MSRTVGGSTIPAETLPRSTGSAIRASLRPALSSLAGPAAICAGVLVVLHSFAFGGLISNQYPDVLPFWLPTYCFLGKSLVAGHIPGWNPHVMGGVPFAADPQSGWMYLPPMLLFSLFSCGVAIRWFIILQPLLGGLGTYAFLRSEGLSRPASTVGGLGLAMPLAGSYLSLNLPFAGTMAWIPPLLAGASKYLRSESWPSRLGWMAAAALAWGQILGANLSDGLALGMLALLFYLVARLAADVGARRRTIGHAVELAALLIVALPLVNLAVLWPRMAYLPRTSISLGYQRLAELSRQLTGERTSGLVFGTGTGPTWPLRLTLPPGAYFGASALALSFAGLWARSKRYLTVAFMAFGALCYVLMLGWVGRGLARALGSSGLASFYLHDPSRFRFGLLVALAFLVGLGTEGWLRARPRDRALMLAPGIVVWGVLPQALGLGVPPWLFVLGAAAGVVALAATARRPLMAAVIPAVLLVELTANGLAGQTSSFLYHPSHARSELNGGPINTLRAPSVRISAFLTPGPIARALASAEGSRFMTLAPAKWDPRGYHVQQRRGDWGLLGMQQSMIIGLEEAQGYNPAQLVRFWKLVRALDPKEIRYNAGFFVYPQPVVFDLLQVGWIIAPAEGSPPVPGAVPTIREGSWALYRMPDPPPRASPIAEWTVARTEAQAFSLTIRPGFDTSRLVVVEGSPALPQPSSGSAASSQGPPGAGTSGSASFRWLGQQSARVTVQTAAPAIVVVRNVFDPNWHARLDGHRVTLLRADYLLQGIAVPPGQHVISLAYDDPTVGYALAGSGVVLALMLVAGVMLWRRGRKTALDSSRPV